jgi:uncharacterized integral membrane protein (TIGR00698 family)
MKQLRQGLALTITIALLSLILSKFILVGAVTIAIIVGIIVGNLVSLSSSYEKGITYSEKMILSFAIALMGINLDFSIIVALGLKTIVLIVVGMVVTIYSAIYIGKLFKLDSKLSLLLGIGNGVCGASAIGATAPILKAEKNHIGLSVAIVNMLGAIGILLLPLIAVTLGLDNIDAGILIGNTLQAVGQVTAAGFSIDDTAGLSATTVKMGRVLLLTPLVFILIYIFVKKENGEAKAVKFPKFILFFILFSLISSFSLVNQDIQNIISTISHLSLIVAMGAVGLKINFSDIKNDGSAALKVASVVFVIQILFSVVVLVSL